MALLPQFPVQIIAGPLREVFFSKLYQRASHSLIVGRDPETEWCNFALFFLFFSREAVENKMQLNAIRATDVEKAATRCCELVKTEPVILAGEQ